MITLKELLELNAQFCELHLCVRDYSKGGAQKIECYHIGSRATEDRSGLHRWKTMRHPINGAETPRGDRRLYYHLTGSIPNELLEMPVHDFQIFPNLGFSLGIDDRMMLADINLVGIEADVKKVTKALEQETDIDKNGQLKGQLSFEL